MTRTRFGDLSREEKRRVIARAVASVVAIGRDDTHVVKPDVVKPDPIKLVCQGVVVVPRCEHCYEPATEAVAVTTAGSPYCDWYHLGTLYFCDWHHDQLTNGGK